MNIPDQVKVLVGKHEGQTATIDGYRVKFADGTTQAYIASSLAPIAAPAPLPPPPPPPPPVILTPTPSWSGALEDGTWRNGGKGWDNSPDYRPDGRPQDFAIVTSPVPPGFAHAGKFTVTKDSVISGVAGQRALVNVFPQTDPTKGKSRAFQGVETWYRDLIRFPADYVAAPNTDWNWLLELHNYPEGCADSMLSLAVVMDTSDGGAAANGERLSCRMMAGGSSAHPAEDYKSGTIANNPDVKREWMRGPKILREHWHDVVLRVRWDWRSIADGGQGSADYYLDGTKIGSYAGPTLLWFRQLSGPGQGYVTAGHYRNNDPTHPDSTVYHAGTMCGPTAASIGVALA
jgi:hypothetical protein